MSASICVLPVQDRVEHDLGPVAVLYRDMGPQAAEQVVARALGELALTLAALSQQVKAQEYEGLARQLRRLIKLSEQLGLVSFARVAQDARQVLERGDGTSFAAVWARLLRVAEQSLDPGRDLLGQFL